MAPSLSPKIAKNTSEALLQKSGNQTKDIGSMEQQKMGRAITYIVRYFFGMRQKTAEIKSPSAADIMVIVKVNSRLVNSKIGRAHV